jgi:hypothetical protein
MGAWHQDGLADWLSVVDFDLANPQLSKENFKEKEKLVAGPRWVHDTKTDWLSVIMWLWLWKRYSTLQDSTLQLLEDITIDKWEF